MTHETDLINDRRDKLTQWQERDWDKNRRFERTHTSREAVSEMENSEVRDVKTIMAKPESTVKMCGRVLNLREMGKLAFLKIRDVEGDFQICLASEVLDEFKTFLKLIDLGDFVGFAGEFFRTKHGEPTLLATEVIPLNKALRPLPEKWHGLTDRETCYRERYLDLATNPETFHRFKLRSQMIRLIRDFFYAKGFDEVETRSLQPQAGGAMADVFSTHHKALDQEFVLRISLELDLKMAVGGGMERVFEIGKCFRNEGMDPSHLQEFTLLEWYAAYEDLATNQQWTEELVRQILTDVFDQTTVSILDKEGKAHEVDFAKPFAIARFPELLAEHAGVDMFNDSDEKLLETAKKLGIEHTNRGRANLLDDIYKKTARPKLIAPTFVYDYPEDLKPLARPKGDGTADCFQLLVGGWEIVNSYGELVDPVVQRELFERQAAAKAAGDIEAMELDEDFLKSMEHGFPPMTGFGMGIDRLLALLTTQPNLRDVVLFPTMKPEGQTLSSREAEERYRSRKLIVIADESVNPGIVANAIGQLGISIGMFCEEKMYDQKVLTDKDGQTHYVDALYPMANLRGDQAQMAEFMQKCYDAGVQAFDFSDIMRKAHTDKQMLEGYKSKKTKEIGYLAVGALVPADFEKAWLSKLEMFGAEKS